MSEYPSPSLCADCGVNTTPRGPDWEWYMVHDQVWADAGMKTGDENHSGRGFLCIGCLEKRLVRQLTPADFKDLPINAWASRESRTARLADRLGLP